MDGSAVGSGMIAEDTLLGIIDTLGGGVIVLDGLGNAKVDELQSAPDK